MSFFNASLWLWLLMLCLALGGCWFETPSSSFSDRADAQRSELFYKGWLPEWIPASAKRIREKHDIDTSATLIRFEFSSPDRPPFDGTCLETTSDALKLPWLDAYWWPEDDTLAEMPHVYRCLKDSGYLAIPGEGGTCLLYTSRWV